MNGHSRIHKPQRLWRFHGPRLLLRALAGLLLLQSLAPGLAYAIMAPADAGLTLTWCRGQGPAGDPRRRPQSPQSGSHFKCPACLFYGHLACALSAANAVPAALGRLHFPALAPRAALPPRPPAVSASRIRAPPASS